MKKESSQTKNSKIKASKGLSLAKSTDKNLKRKSQESLIPVAQKPAISATSPSSKNELVSQDPLKKYLIEVSQYPLLSPDEEKEIATHYKIHKDKESAQKLVLSNLRLVVKIAYEYRNAFMNMLDLIQEGNIGLMRAVQKYDVEKGVRFSSYAVWWVRAFILKFILDNFKLVKIGTTQAQKKLFFNLMKEKERIEKQGFEVTTQLLAQNLDVKQKTIEEMQSRLGSRDIELDAPRSADESSLFVDTLKSDAETPDQEVENKQIHSLLMDNLKGFTQTLSDKERDIFSERLFSEIPKTLQEIADEYHITRERVRQIENRVITKMRQYFKDKGMKIDIDPKE